MRPDKSFPISTLKMLIDIFWNYWPHHRARICRSEHHTTVHTSNNTLETGVELPVCRTISSPHIIDLSAQTFYH